MKHAAQLKAAVAAIEGNALTEAERILARLLKRDRKHPDALKLAGVVAYRQGQFVRAVALLERGAKVAPHDVGTLANLCAALNCLGRCKEAQRRGVVALELAPNDALVLSNLGKNALDQRHYDDACKWLERAVGADRNNWLAHHNLGVCLREVGDTRAAINALQTAMGLANSVETVAELIITLRASGDDETAAELARGLFARPDAGDAILGAWEIFFDTCDFEAVTATRARVLAMLQAPTTRSTCGGSVLMLLNSLAGLEPSETLAAHRAWASHHSSLGLTKVGATRSPQTDTRLRIGYLSPDFRDHSVGLFIEPVISAHDARRYAVYCYANSSPSDDLDDPVNYKIRATATSFVDAIALSDAELAARIRADNIDVLIDLAGHTRGTRVAVMRERLAPVQVTWLGYPNTTGLDTMDYRISDPYVDDPNSREYTEDIYRLPETFICCGGFEDVERSAVPPVASSGQLSFGSYNNVRKFTAELIDCWVKILAAVPNSRLLIKAGRATAPLTRRNLLAAFASGGISAERIELRDVLDSRRAHLATYNDIDLALDTFPYNGTTTTCEALWMGVPVLTLRGRRHASRVSYSILRNCGLDELVVDSVDDYISLATTLANDLPRLAQLRELAAKRFRNATLCKPQHFTAQLESAYEAMLEASRPDMVVAAR